jgi:predicted O-methyltransferase YrrM
MNDPVSTKPWNSKFYGLPPKIKAIPTMLTDEEGRMLRWLTEFVCQGKSAICESGSFVGGSTARLAFSLSKNTGTTGIIHSFDRFSLLF